MEGEKIYLNKKRKTPARLFIESSKPPVQIKKDNAPAGFIEYTVKAGDTLYSISIKFKITIQEIRDLNLLENDIIHPGDLLKIPKHD